MSTTPDGVDARVHHFSSAATAAPRSTGTQSSASGAPGSDDAAGPVWSGALTGVNAPADEHRQQRGCAGAVLSPQRGEWTEDGAWTDRGGRWLARAEGGASNHETSARGLVRGDGADSPPGASGVSVSVVAPARSDGQHSGSVTFTPATSPRSDSPHKQRASVTTAPAGHSTQAGTRSSSSASVNQAVHAAAPSTSTPFVLLSNGRRVGASFAAERAGCAHTLLPPPPLLRMDGDDCGDREDSLTDYTEAAYDGATGDARYIATASSCNFLYGLDEAEAGAPGSRGGLSFPVGITSSSSASVSGRSPLSLTGDSVGRRTPGGTRAAFTTAVRARHPALPVQASTLATSLRGGAPSATSSPRVATAALRRGGSSPFLCSQDPRGSPGPHGPPSILTMAPGAQAGLSPCARSLRHGGADGGVPFERVYYQRSLTNSLGLPSSPAAAGVFSYAGPRVRGVAGGTSKLALLEGELAASSTRDDGALTPQTPQTPSAATTPPTRPGPQLYARAPLTPTTSPGQPRSPPLVADGASTPAHGGSAATPVARAGTGARVDDLGTFMLPPTAAALSDTTDERDLPAGRRCSTPCEAAATPTSHTPPLTSGGAAALTAGLGTGPPRGSRGDSNGLSGAGGLAALTPLSAVSPHPSYQRSARGLFSVVEDGRPGGASALCTPVQRHDNSLTGWLAPSDRRHSGAGVGGMFGSAGSRSAAVSPIAHRLAAAGAGSGRGSTGCCPGVAPSPSLFGTPVAAQSAAAAVLAPRPFPLTRRMRAETLVAKIDRSPVHWGCFGLLVAAGSVVVALSEDLVTRAERMVNLYAAPAAAPDTVTVVASTPCLAEAGPSFTVRAGACPLSGAAPASSASGELLYFAAGTQQGTVTVRVYRVLSRSAALRQMETAEQHLDGCSPAGQTGPACTRLHSRRSRRSAAVAAAVRAAPPGEYLSLHGRRELVARLVTTKELALFSRPPGGAVAGAVSALAISAHSLYAGSTVGELVRYDLRQVLAAPLSPPPSMASLIRPMQTASPTAAGRYGWTPPSAQQTPPRWQPPLRTQLRSPASATRPAAPAPTPASSEGSTPLTVPASADHDSTRSVTVGPPTHRFLPPAWRPPVSHAATSAETPTAHAGTPTGSGGQRGPDGMPFSRSSADWTGTASAPPSTAAAREADDPNAVPDGLTDALAASWAAMAATAGPARLIRLQLLGEGIVHIAVTADLESVAIGTTRRLVVFKENQLQHWAEASSRTTSPSSSTRRPEPLVVLDASAQPVRSFGWLHTADAPHPHGLPRERGVPTPSSALRGRGMEDALSFSGQGSCGEKGRSSSESRGSGTLLSSPHAAWDRAGDIRTRMLAPPAQSPVLVFAGGPDGSELCLYALRSHRVVSWRSMGRPILSIQCSCQSRDILVSTEAPAPADPQQLREQAAALAAYREVSTASPLPLPPDTDPLAASGFASLHASPALAAAPTPFASHLRSASTALPGRTQTPHTPGGGDDSGRMGPAAAVLTLATPARRTPSPGAATAAVAAAARPPSGRALGSSAATTAASANATTPLRLPPSFSSPALAAATPTSPTAAPFAAEYERAVLVHIEVVFEDDRAAAIAALSATAGLSDTVSSTNGSRRIARALSADAGDAAYGGDGSFDGCDAALLDGAREPPTLRVRGYAAVASPETAPSTTGGPVLDCVQVVLAPDDSACATVGSSSEPYLCLWNPLLTGRTGENSGSNSSSSSSGRSNSSSSDSDTGVESALGASARLLSPSRAPADSTALSVVPTAFTPTTADFAAHDVLR